MVGANRIDFASVQFQRGSFKVLIEFRRGFYDKWTRS